MLDHQKINKTLPDIPKWIYAKSLLNFKNTLIYGDDKKNLIIIGTLYPLICILGKPSLAHLQKLLHSTKNFEILAFSENEKYVSSLIPKWKREKAIIYRQTNSIEKPDKRVKPIKEKDANFIEDSFWKKEIKKALSLKCPVFALFINNEPVSFHYSLFQTKKYYNVAGFTRENFRKPKITFNCLKSFIFYQQKTGKKAVIGSSKTLKKKFLFEPVDEIFVFSNPLFL
jgi:hypothetical protein